jgi:AmpE protein
MSFLVLVLVLLLEKFSSLRVRVQRDGFWLGLLARIERDEPSDERAWLNLALLVLAPALLLGLLLWLLQPFAYGWLVLPLHVLVVLYALGRGDVLTQMGPFRDAWRRGDVEAAWLAGQRDLALAENETEVLPAAQHWLVWQAYQRFFAVIFWYALLGPVPALIYRLLDLTENNAQHSALRERAALLRHALDWLPARALMATFAFVGNFLAVGRILAHELLSWEGSAARLVADAAVAAEQLPPSQPGEVGVAALDDLWQLLVRSAMLWYATFAVWVLVI